MILLPHRHIVNRAQGLEGTVTKMLSNEEIASGKEPVVAGLERPGYFPNVRAQIKGDFQPTSQSHAKEI